MLPASACVGERGRGRKACACDTAALALASSSVHPSALCAQMGGRSDGPSQCTIRATATRKHLRAAMSTGPLLRMRHALYHRIFISVPSRARDDQAGNTASINVTKMYRPAGVDPGKKNLRGLNYIVSSTSSYLGTFNLLFMMKKIE